MKQKSCGPLAALGARRPVLSGQPPQVVSTAWASTAPSPPTAPKHARTCNHAPPRERQQRRIRRETTPHRPVGEVDPPDLPTQRPQLAYFNNPARFVPRIGQARLGQRPSPERCERPAGFIEVPGADRPLWHVNTNTEIPELVSGPLSPPPLDRVVSMQCGTGREGHDPSLRPERRSVALRHRVLACLLPGHLVPSNDKGTEKGNGDTGHAAKRGKAEYPEHSSATSHRHAVYPPQR